MIGPPHAVVGGLEPRLVGIEAVGVFHDELARAHQAESRPDFVTKLRLNLKGALGQVFVGLDLPPEDVGDDLLVGRPQTGGRAPAVFEGEHDPVHGRVTLPPPRFLPQLPRLQGGHQRTPRRRPPPSPRARFATVSSASGKAAAYRHKRRPRAAECNRPAASANAPPFARPWAPRAMSCPKVCFVSSAPTQCLKSRPAARIEFKPTAEGARNADFSFGSRFVAAIRWSWA